jgi:carboxypeptidase C (cathepsin A)
MMQMMKILACSSLCLLSCLANEPNLLFDKPKESSCVDKEIFSKTQHEVKIGGEMVSYEAVAGNLLLKGDDCSPKASLFFISYTRTGPDVPKNRPVTFCFNGGPGSSSIWLHLGLCGPKRVDFNDEGQSLPPYHLVDNESSLLDTTDLVFIDPVSTGYSKAIPKTEEKSFHGVNQDIECFSDFIRQYLTQFNRWDCPKFLMGESYGTTRAAGLANYLHDNEFIYVNGVLLISTVLNFQSIDFNDGNDLPYLLFLPSYTAAAWQHQKLSPELQASLPDTLKKSVDFVQNEYLPALFKGDLLKDEEKDKVIAKLSLFTGLSKEYLDKSKLRVDSLSFNKELLRNDGLILGRFDSSITGLDKNRVAQKIEYDPSMESCAGAFTASFNHYLQNDLKWEPVTNYKILTNVFPWDYGCSNEYLNVSNNLRDVLTKNPMAEVFVASGYFDLATPFFATEYTFNHLKIDPSLKSHVTIKNYEGGHMMYLNPKTLIELKKDLVEFYQKALKKE